MIINVFALLNHRIKNNLDWKGPPEII